MTRYLIYVLIVCGSLNVAVAQPNLIPNPSFEVYNTCDYNHNYTPIEDILSGWSYKLRTPRYYNMDCVDDPQSSYYQYNFSPPQDGKGYVAPLYDPLNPDVPGLERREYLQVSPKQVIEEDKDYYLSYYMTIPYKDYTPISHYGVHLNNTLWEGSWTSKFNDSILPEAQIEIDSMLNLEYGQWQKVEHCFNPDSSYSVLVFGVFAEEDKIQGKENIEGFTFYAYDNFYLAEIEEEVELNEYRDTICAGECITLSTNHSRIPGSFEWKLPGRDIGSSTDSVVRPCYDTPGTYEISIDIEHCTGRYEGEFAGAVTVVENIDHEPHTDSTICPGESIRVDLPDQYDISWQDGSSVNPRTITEEGNYQYVLDNSVCRDTHSFSINYAVQPESKTTELYSCPEESVSFLGETYSDPGSYRDTLRSREGCDSVFYTIDYQYYVPQPIQIEGDYGFCPGESTTLDIVSDHSNIQWADGDGARSKTFDTEQSIILSYRDDNQCEYTDTVNIERFPEPTVETQDLTDAWYEEGMALSAGYNGSIEAYHWTPSAGLSCSDCPYPNLIEPKEGLYTIEVSNQFDCRSADTLSVSFKELNVYVPNIVNPHSDNKENRSLYAMGNVDFEYALTVYDRWGNLLFHNDQARANQPEDGWFPEDRVNAGVFVYLIEYRENGKTITKSGDVTVVNQ